MNKIDEDVNIGLLLEKKIFLTTQYLSATKEMEESLKHKAEKNINIFISKRLDCINKIKRIDMSVQSAIHNGSDRFKEIFDKYFNRIKILLEQIVPIDASIMIMVKAESRSIKDELLKMNSVRHASRGYGQKGNQFPRYLDDKR
ncbi:MAG: hypothetical protein KKC46_03100 [Proteobacteria bacterium]|nr:hypothetical protein [Pseudomonadota bacterium]